MTRKIILYIAQSLDGYIAKTDGNIDWLTRQEQDERLDDFYLKFTETIDTVVMGKKTYDQLVEDLSPEEWPYVDMHTYVLTTKPMQSTMDITFIHEDTVNFLHHLKQKKGQNIWIVGGLSVISPLVTTNLIDEYYITTTPVLLGDGIPLFQKGIQPVTLQQAHILPLSNMVMAVYQKK